MHRNFSSNKLPPVFLAMQTNPLSFEGHVKVYLQSKLLLKYLHKVEQALTKNQLLKSAWKVLTWSLNNDQTPINYFWQIQANWRCRDISLHVWCQRSWCTRWWWSVWEGVQPGVECSDISIDFLSRVARRGAGSLILKITIVVVIEHQVSSSKSPTAMLDSNIFQKLTSSTVGSSEYSRTFDFELGEGGSVGGRGGRGCTHGRNMSCWLLWRWCASASMKRE